MYGPWSDLLFFCSIHNRSAGMLQKAPFQPVLPALALCKVASCPVILLQTSWHDMQVEVSLSAA